MVDPVQELGFSTKKANPETLRLKLGAGLYKIECLSRDSYGKEVKSSLPLMVLPEWGKTKFGLKLPSVAKLASATVEVGGGAQGKSIVTAVVRDINGNGVPSVAVTFSSNALGSVSPFSGTTAAGTGAATTTFTSGGFLGVATVTATAGVTLTASTNILITAGPPCTGTIKAVPTGFPANGVATSTITVALTDCVGFPVPDGTMVGFTTTKGSMLNYAYVEAESTEVISSTGWTVGSSGTASGGQFIGTSSSGAAVFWTFRGEAVSLTYYRYAGGGQMGVRVDGGAPVIIDSNASPAGWVERVIATNLNPAITHQIEVTHQSGTIYLDVFRSGAMTVSGVAANSRPARP